MIELRCDGTMHGRLDPEAQTIEVKCVRRGCGASKQVVVLHTFSLTTGKMVDTRRFANPPRRRTDGAS